MKDTLKLRIPLHEDSWSLLELPETVTSRKCSKKRCEVCENVQNSDDKFR